MKKAILSLMVLLICSIAIAQRNVHQVNFEEVKKAYNNNSTSKSKIVDDIVRKIKELDKVKFAEIFDALTTENLRPPTITYTFDCDGSGSPGSCASCMYWNGILIGCSQEDPY